MTNLANCARSIDEPVFDLKIRPVAGSPHAVRCLSRYFASAVITGTGADVHGFPPHLAIEDQGQFVVGHYQQRQKLFTKRPKEQGASE
jgi:hypothetical protein